MSPSVDCQSGLGLTHQAAAHAYLPDDQPPRDPGLAACVVSRAGCPSEGIKSPHDPRSPHPVGSKNQVSVWVSRDTVNWDTSDKAKHVSRISFLELL